MRRVILVCTLFFAAATLIAEGAVLSSGMTAHVNDNWIVCSMQESARRLGIYLKAGDQYGIDAIINHGLGVNVSEGTRVRIVDAVAGYFEVRIINGINTGYLGWISGDFLVPGP